MLGEAVLPGRRGEEAGELALGFGLVFALVSMTTATAQCTEPLAGVMTLLLWCYVSSIALFFGTATAAQLEALRAGVGQPILPDPGPTHGSDGKPST